MKIEPCAVVFEEPLEEISSLFLDKTEYKPNGKFKGFLSMPPGFHILEARAPNRKTGQTQSIPFYFFQEKPMILLRFSKEGWEELTEVDPNFKSHTQAFDKGELSSYMLPYSSSLYTSWAFETRYITPERLQSHSEPNTLWATELLFSPVDLQQKERLKSIPPELRTQNCLDRTEQIAWLLTQEFSEKNQNDALVALLGDLQLAWLSFQAETEISTFCFWRNWVFLLCQSEDLSKNRPDFYGEFLSCLEHWLVQLPSSFFYDFETKESFLSKSLANLLENIQNNPIYLPRFTAIDRLLRSHFNLEWQPILTDKKGQPFPNAMDDDAPVFIDEDQIKIKF